VTSQKTWIPETIQSFRQEVTYGLWHLYVHYYLHNQPATVSSTKPDKSIHTASSHLFKTNFDINVTRIPSLECHPVSSCFFESLPSTLQAVTVSSYLPWSPYWHIISGLTTVWVLTTCHTQYTWDKSIWILLFNRTTLQVFVTYLTGALYVHPLWFYKHQYNN